MSCCCCCAHSVRCSCRARYGVFLSLLSSNETSVAPFPQPWPFLSQPLTRTILPTCPGSRRSQFCAIFAEIIAALYLFIFTAST